MFQETVVEKIKIYILGPTIFSPENRTVYEKKWENMVQPDRLQMTTCGAQKMRFACRITKARKQTLRIFNRLFIRDFRLPPRSS